MRYDSEIFCRCNPHGIDADHIPGRSPYALDDKAIMQAMQGSSRAELALGLLMVDKEKTGEFNKLCEGLVKTAKASREYKSLKDVNKKKIQVLCGMAIAEFISRPSCPQCNGTGVKSDYTTCKACNGTSLKPISNTKRANVLGKRHSSWYIYQDMYAFLMKSLQVWQDRNLRKLNKRLK